MFNNKCQHESQNIYEGIEEWSMKTGYELIDQ